MRALIVTNMYPSAERPALGSYVRDQVVALRRRGDVEVELFSFAPGSPRSYALAGARLARRTRAPARRGATRAPATRAAAGRYDIVHAHYGLTILPSLAARARRRLVTLHGTDLSHPRSRAITLASLRFVDLVATASEALAAQLPPGAGRGLPRAVLPCGVDLTRFRPIPRAEARRALGLDPDGPYLLFPADPARPEKRYDRAAAVAGDTRLLALGAVPPAEVPLWVNAANAVLVPSEREGFGLAVLEALACEVPVLATPVGIAPRALAGVDGALCEEFEAGRWREALAAHLAAADPRLSVGRERAAGFSSDAMAAEVVAAWRALLRDARP